jgi:hypothetical protein
MGRIVLRQIKVFRVRTKWIGLIRIFWQRYRLASPDQQQLIF